jgi:uncharacterized membrane protein
MHKVSSKIDKTVGVIAYLTLIGFGIGIILNLNRTGSEKKFGAFHLRQSLGVILGAIAVSIAIQIVTTILSAIGIHLEAILNPLMYLAILGFVVIGVVNAGNGEKKPLPYIGVYAEKFLKQLFE